MGLHTAHVMDTRKTVSRLLGLEIDEVSLVDRPANQHGLVTITKRDEGPMTKLFDDEGNEVSMTDLEFGQTVSDEDGNVFEYVSPDDAEALAAEGEELFVPQEFVDEADQDDEDEDADDREPELVGKSAMPDVFQAGRKLKTRSLDELENLRGGWNHARSGRAPARVPTTAGTAQVGAHAGRNAERYAVGAAAGTSGAVYGRQKGRKSVKKSLGDQVLTELSKALTEGDRDAVISKAMEHVEAANEAAEYAISKAEQLEYEREVGQYVELAKSYQLPVDEDELGPILHTIAKSGLTDEQLDLVDRVFAAAGESIAYDELGSPGIAPSAVEEVVKSYANDIVAKSDLSEEQAMVALFEQNPEMYDQYLTEKA